MAEVDRFEAEHDEPVDNLIIYLRSYMTGAPARRRGSRAKNKKDISEEIEPEPTNIPIPEWVLVFDCETTTTPDQRLRFGCYQLRHRGQLWEHGFFYEPTLPEDEVDLLNKMLGQQREEVVRTYLRTRAEFVDEVLLQAGVRHRRDDRWLQPTIRYLSSGDRP